MTEAPVERKPAGRVRRRLAVALVALGAFVFASLLAFGFGRDPRALPSALEGGPAPGFSLRHMDTGEVIRLRDLRGQVVVVNFWASWCAACRREHPALLAAWERYRDRGVVMLGVLFQDTEANARAYMDELGGDWPTLLDPGSRTAVDYGVAGIPETFFIGRDGRIAHKQIGESTYDVLVTWIERLLRAPAAGGGT